MYILKSNRNVIISIMIISRVLQELKFMFALWKTSSQVLAFYGDLPMQVRMKSDLSGRKRELNVPDDRKVLF